MRESLTPAEGLADSTSRLWKQIPRFRRIQFAALLALILASALAEVITVGSVFPFLGVLTSPQLVLDHPIGSLLGRVLNITAARDLLLPLTVIFASAALMAGMLRLLLLWSLNRLALNTGADLSIEVYRRTLHQPYQTHIARSSSEVIAAINSKINDVVFGTILSLLQFVSATVIVVALAAVLFALSPMVAGLVGLFLGGGYAVVVRVARRELARRSQSIAREQTQVIKALQEGLGGIREVLLDGVQGFYSEIFRKSIQPLRRDQGDVIFIGQAPRYVLEALGVALIAAIAYVMEGEGNGLTATLPILGAMALGAQRLLPALQQSYGCWVSITGSRSSLVDVLKLLEEPLPSDATDRPDQGLKLQRVISFDSVRFRYAEQGPWVLDGLNLRINRGVRLALVGRTGSGKSTALDLLMGLLDPEEGKITVDGKPLESVRRSWQRTVAHVPQAIYLADATLAENIAFGQPADSIDFNRVKEAARQAQLSEFIADLPEQYLTRVGERGVRLSGGQRQRVGIARALYKRASVLVFDEATSALDNETERAVMAAIEGLNRELTVILIAHRLTTVRHCDLIVEIDNGRAVAQGTYEELMDISATFRHMVTAGNMGLDENGIS